MNLNQALLLCGQLVSLGLFLSGIEFLRISSKPEVHRVWSPEILLSEFKRSLPTPDIFKRWLASKGSLRQLALAEMILAVAALIAPSAPMYLALFVIHFLICLRFRGTFNGGSDQMFLQVLLSLSIGFGFYNSGFGKWALVYLAVQLLYSYFKAGVSKLKSPSWRTGLAVSSFLKANSYRPELKGLFDRNANLLRVGSWAVIVAEILMPLSALNLRAAFLFCGVALLFHLMNVGLFGLNRFFWAWLSAWPAVFYMTTLI